MKNNLRFKYKDIEFIESGSIVSIDEEKETLKFLASNIHIIGFKDLDDSYMAFCLEYGLVADGKDKEETMDRIVSITRDFLLHNTTKVIDKILTSSHMDEYWGLYRLYEKKHSPKKLKIFKKKLQQKNNIHNDSLVEDNKVLQQFFAKTKVLMIDLVIDWFIQHVKPEKDANNLPMFIPTGETYQWAKAVV